MGGGGRGCPGLLNGGIITLTWVMDAAKAWSSPLDIQMKELKKRRKETVVRRQRFSSLRLFHTPTDGVIPPNEHGWMNLEKKNHPTIKPSSFSWLLEANPIAGFSRNNTYLALTLSFFLASCPEDALAS